MEACHCWQSAKYNLALPPPAGRQVHRLAESAGVLAKRL